MTTLSKKSETNILTRNVVLKIQDFVNQNKNIRLLPAFKEKYPDCNSSTSNHSDKYNKIIVESMDTDGENENKIITKITKEVIVEKDTLTL